MPHQISTAEKSRHRSQNGSRCTGDNSINGTRDRAIFKKVYGKMNSGRAMKIHAL